MEQRVARPDDFAGRHLIVDASTYNRRNLTSTDTVFSLFESMARNLDMTLVIPPIVCRYPFANSELETFCDDVESELKRKMSELGEASLVDLNLGPIAVMRHSLKRRQMEESGVTGIGLWAESHCAIHAWDEDLYLAFDAFSCKDFNPADALRLMLNSFDMEMVNGVDLLRFQRGAPRITHFQVNDRWEVIVDGRKAGDLESYAALARLDGPDELLLLAVYAISGVGFGMRIALLAAIPPTSSLGVTVARSSVLPTAAVAWAVSSGRSWLGGCSTSQGTISWLLLSRPRASRRPRWRRGSR
jgi:S-adenosylmethionine decarboxylase